MSKPKRVVVWFSCGAASAVCADLALRKYREAVPVVLAYTDPGTWETGKIGEHPDNQRFLEECSAWLNWPINILRSEKYTSPMDVFKKRKYIAGVAGAPCTLELKKRCRERFQEPGDLQVFGFTSEEEKRAARFRGNNPEIKLWTPLIERMITKADTLAYLKSSGIKLPAMYDMGYRNNNCIGCVKGQSGYWNKIRLDFPDVFDATAKLEREIGAAICKTEPTVKGKRQRIPVYLDELPKDAGNYNSEPDIECGLLCQMAIQEEFCDE